MFSINLADMSKTTKIILLFLLGCLGGVAGIVLYVTQTAFPFQALSIIGVALSIAGAALLSGGFLGFLFGIPRTLQHESTSDQTKADGPAYRANTNLEQISDWLTKILVGVGLTEISNLPGALKGFGEYAKLSLGNYDNSAVFAMALLVYFTICGFLAGYIGTRLFLQGALAQADLAMGAKVTELEKADKQNKIDSEAERVVMSQLFAPRDSPNKSAEEIANVIKPASRATKARIFYQAQDVRSSNWRDPQTKAAMERTIPVFQALIAIDTENQFHANHGQLGFALKDKRNPDCAGAISELTKAIEMRGSWKDNGWLLYEYNRAICRINLDSARIQHKASDDQTKQIIFADLKAAASVPDLLEMINKEPLAVEWLNLNRVKLP